MLLDYEALTRLKFAPHGVIPLMFNIRFMLGSVYHICVGQDCLVTQRLALSLK